MKQRLQTLPLLILAISFSGCTTAPGSASLPPGQGWEDRVNSIREEAKGTPYEAFTLEVLNDGIVSDAELLEIQSRHLACVEEQGVEGYTFDTVGGTSLGRASSTEELKRLDQVDDECQKKLGTRWLNSLYYLMRQNPTNTDQDAIIAACLVKLGVVNPSYTGQQFQEEFTGYMETHSDNEGKVSGDPYDAISYTVEKSQGKEALYTCMTSPQSVLDFTRGSSD